MPRQAGRQVLQQLDSAVCTLLLVLASRGSQVGSGSVGAWEVRASSHKLMMHIRLCVGPVGLLLFHVVPQLAHTPLKAGWVCVSSQCNGMSASGNTAQGHTVLCAVPLWGRIVIRSLGRWCMAAGMRGLVAVL